MVIMRVEGVIPTQEELTHMVAEVDQVNILWPNAEYEECCNTKIRFKRDADLCSFVALTQLWEIKCSQQKSKRT